MQSTANAAGHPTGDMPGLTALRGVAALGVVLFHIDVCLFYREIGTLLPKAASGLIANGYLWVDLFFILSGYVIHHAYRRALAPGFRWSAATGFYRARFFRIYPLHLVLTLALVVAVGLVGATWPAVTDDSWSGFFAWSALPSNLLLTHAMNQHSYLSWNIVSWSIGAEWWSYLLAPIVIPMIASRGRWSGAVTVASGAFVLVALYVMLGRNTLDITFDFGAVRCLGGFLLGIGVYQLHRAGPPLSALVADLLALAATAGIVLVMHFDATDLLAVPLFCLLVPALGSSGGLVHRLTAMPVLQDLGRISYSIYLVHGLVFLAFWYAAPAFGWRFDQPIAAWAFAAGFLALTVAGAAVTYKLVELPGRGLAHRQSAKPVRATGRA